MSEKLVNTIVNLDRDGALDELNRLVSEGADPCDLLTQSQGGMEIVGKKFEKGDYFLSELLLSAEIFKYIAAELEPLLSKGADAKAIGKVIMATPKGDIHDLGKNIVSLMLKTRGFEVIDLGVDVPLEKILETAREEKPDVIGLSCLLTTVIDDMRVIEGQLREAGIRESTRLMIGGGVTNDSTLRHVGADFQSTDVLEAVNYCMEVVNA